MFSIYDDTISNLMLLSFYSILSTSSVVGWYIALHHTYLYEPILIIVTYFICYISISHTVL